MGRNTTHHSAETNHTNNTASASAPKDPKRKNIRFAEIAGGKMAECAAIFCCCPCGLANLLFLAAVRLPAGLFCRAIQKRSLIRRAKKKAKLFGSGSNSGGSSGSGSVNEDGSVALSGAGRGVVMVIAESWPVRSPAVEVVEFEKEVWSKFCRGFWRSLSQKDDL